MTKIIYASIHPHTTWRLKVSHSVKKQPKKLLIDLEQAGWVNSISKPAPKDTVEVTVAYPGSDSFAGDWTSKERETAMSGARKVLAKHGFDVVPYHKLELVDCL